MIPLAVALLSVLPAQGQERHEWPQYKGGPGLTGVSADPSVKPPLKLLWSYRTDGDTSGDAGAGVIVGGGKVFVNVTNTSSIVALDAENGRFVWEYADPGLGHNMVPSYDEGRVYLLKRRSKLPQLVALEAVSGKVLWEVTLKASDVVGGRFGVPVHGGKVFGAEGGDDPAVLAFEASTGKPVWRTSVGAEDGRYLVSPSAAGGRVFVSIRSHPSYGKSTQGAAVALDAADGKLLWRRKDVFSFRPLASDGRVVGCSMVYSSDMKSYLLEARTGETIWAGPTGAGYSPMTLTNSLVLFHPYGSGFLAWDRATGKELWKFPQKGGTGCSTPVVSGDFAYFGTGCPDNNDSESLLAWSHVDAPREKGVGWTIYAVDLKTGKPAWSFGTGCNVCGDPALAYGRLYFCSRDGRVYCFAPAREGEPTVPEAKHASPSAPPAEVEKLLGPPPAAPALKPPLEPAWSLDTGGRVLAGAAIHDGRVYAGSDSGKVFGIDASSGKPAWEFACGGAVRSSPAVAGGIVYVGSDAGVFHALDAASGREQWRFEAGGPIEAPPAIAGDVVIFGAHDHHVYALDRRTGRKLWSFRAGNYRFQASPVVHDGQVFAGSWTDWVYALDLATGKPQWRSYVPVTVEALAVHRGKLWVRTPYYGMELDPATGKRQRIASAPYGYGAPAFVGGRMYLSGTRGQYGPFGAVWVDLDSPGRENPRKIPTMEDVLLLNSKGLPGGSGDLVAMSAPVAVGERICFAGRNGKVTLVEPDGKPVWSQTLGGACHSAPAAGEGILVVGCDDGRVYAFREKR